MEDKLKVNSLAIASFISGIIVLASLGLYFALSQNLLKRSDNFPLEIMNQILLILMEFSIPIRNIFAPLAVLTGFFGLREINKNEIKEKGEILAWMGMLLGAGWIILGIVVSMVFFLAKVFA